MNIRYLGQEIRLVQVKPSDLELYRVGTRLWWEEDLPDNPWFVVSWTLKPDPQGFCTALLVRGGCWAWPREIKFSDFSEK